MPMTEKKDIAVHKQEDSAILEAAGDDSVVIKDLQKSFVGSIKDSTKRKR